MPPAPLGIKVQTLGAKMRLYVHKRNGIRTMTGRYIIVYGEVLEKVDWSIRQLQYMEIKLMEYMETSRRKLSLAAFHRIVFWVVLARH